MINFDYSNGQIKITTGELKNSFKEEQLPLRFEIKKAISKEVIWFTNLSSHMWAVYPENEINDVVVYDVKGNFVYQYYWDVFNHGSIFYKSLWLYCKSIINEGRKPRGLVVGTHDGEFGEWVPLVRNFMSDMLLIEASEMQFNKLKNNFEGRDGISVLNSLITPNGGDVEFFEGGRGYTNSVVERVIRGWEQEEIHSSVKNSISFNSIIEQYGGNLDWIHLDVEGLDAKLLISLKDQNIPNFIIFEDYNLSPEDSESINKWIIDKNFIKHSQDGICMITKN